METKYVTGIAIGHGGSGDPSPFTARGVYMGIKACTMELFKTEDLKGIRIAVQGVGSVGRHLIELLAKEGAEVIATDVDQERLKVVCEKYKCKMVAPDEIYSVDADIFAPCALGAVVNDDTINKFKYKIIAGGANNQLKEHRHGDILRQKGILYAPDYVINAGGLMNVYLELEGYSHDRALNMTRGIFYNLRKVFALAKSENVSTNIAADKVAEERIEKLGRIKRTHLGRGGLKFNNIKIENR